MVLKVVASILVIGEIVLLSGARAIDEQPPSNG
jgi:hypothetical protein